MAHEHEHQHTHQPSSLKILIFAIAITGLFAIVEAVTGYMANSLTLMGDAGHMVADTLSLMIAAGAAWISLRPPSQHKTFGFGRIEVIAAFISGLLLLGIVVSIILEAIDHLKNPVPVYGKMVIVIGVIGLLANIAVAWVLHAGEKNLNVHAALLHVISDLLGSVAAILAGVIIYISGWMPIDPILSFFISILILRSTWRLLKKTFNVLMQGTPESIDFHAVKAEMEKVDGVISIHDLHIWTLTSEQLILTAHVVLHDFTGWNKTLENLKKLLANNYHIHHATLQPESQSSKCCGGCNRDF